MDGLDFIQSKQLAWACRKGLSPTDKEGYLMRVEDNLYEPLSSESVTAFSAGNGLEMADGVCRPAKMKALYSSSALVVNVFHHWQGRDARSLMCACGLCDEFDAQSSIYDIKFEQKLPISADRRRFPVPPHVDVLITAADGCVYAVEGKFAEPYRGHSKGISLRYVEDVSLWEGLPYLHELAWEVASDNHAFRYLDAAQLLKHILGLKAHCTDAPFRLLYLWYDVPGEAGCAHRREINRFADIARKDHVAFFHTTYQVVFVRLLRNSYNGNEAYCDYLNDRYL